MGSNGRVMEPFEDCVSNLAETLAVDLEEPGDIFQPGQLMAGAPAGLDEGTRKRRHSLQHCLSPTIPSQPPPTTLPDPNSSNSWQTIHEKYADIFAPLDFSAPKRGSISSTDSSTDLEPTSVGTRGSVLTLDTSVDSDQAASPAFLHFSPNSDTAQVSWIDFDDVLSPLSQRRRSSMSDFSKYRQQARRPTEHDTLGAMSLRSPVIDGTEAPMSPGSERTLIHAGIPQRRSSLKHHGTYAGTQQSSQYFNQDDNRHDSLHFTSTTGPYYDASRLRTRDDVGTQIREDEFNTPFTSKDIPTSESQPYSAPKETMPSKSQGSEDATMVSAKVGFEEWLQSDLEQQSTSGDQMLPRPLPPNLQEHIKFFVANFPEPMLMCNSLLIENIRNLSHRVRYNADGLSSDFSSTPAHQPNNQQRHKLPKWKWLGSSTQHQAQQPDAALTYSKPEWMVMRKIFPHGSDDLCEALYAYVVVYNYVTSLCIRYPVLTLDSSRPTTPWAARANPGVSTNVAGPSSLGSTLQHSPLETGVPVVPLKAATVLGLMEEDISTTHPLIGVARPTSRASVRASTFGTLRGMPSLFFNGSGHGQQRSQGSDASFITRPTTPAFQQNSLSRPATPAAGMRSMTPMGLRGVDISKMLAELRYGLAMCCARLTVTLHRSNPSIKNRKADKDCKVDPSFMRSLCEIVRATEDTIGRCH